ncbi:MAG: DUF58 domain-containing protein [Candidatus Poribacteria bacterium]|nr:DUF58 domain-containing protein [Candidatus Poribacteria bacterium]
MTELLSPEVFKNVRRIEMVAMRLVTHLFTGEYHSVFKGQGIEFAEVRPYEPGDDVRTIDWNVTARTGVAHIKRYVEERESVLMLLVDASGSLRVGSRGLKSQLCAEVAAVLALAAIQNNDKVGLILFTDRVEKYVPPRKGRRHVLRVVREILTHQPERRGTNLSEALAYFARVNRKRCTAFVLSDFHQTDGNGYDAALKRAAARHDLVAVEIRDPMESRLPNVGIIRWIDAETNALRVTHTGVELDAQTAVRAERFRRHRVDHVPLSTGESYVEPLLAFFRRREKRRLHY